MILLKISILTSKPNNFLTLPVNVCAPDGSILACGVVHSGRTTKFQIENKGRDFKALHVVCKLPNGKILHQAADVASKKAEAILRLNEMSPHEWLDWATPFRSMEHLKPMPSSERFARSIGKVWMTHWVFENENWVAQDLIALEQYRDTGMQQIVLDTPHKPQLIQVGGENVAWRLISLPPGGAVQIALTRSDREYGDTLDVTLGRKNPDNDLIMSYLASGAIEEANRLGEALKDADLLLYRKINDPVAAAAGAYFLLKSDNLKRRQSWVKNLVNWFPYLADGPILSAALGVQSDDVPESQIRDMITLALNRGLPVFSLGMTLLMETMAAIHRGDKESKKFHSAYLAVQAYTRARRSKGVYFSFHGKSPAEPTWVPIYGMEGAADYRGAVVYSRARGSRQKAKFGGLSISLPRAPVAARIIDELNIGTDTRRAEESTLLNLKAIQLENWPSEGVYRNTKILGLPVIETNFLNDFSVQSKRIATGFLMSQPESIENSFRIEKVKSNPKKVTKNWNEQRIKHATTVFDGTD